MGGLIRALLVDCAVAGSRGAQAAGDADAAITWTYLVPRHGAGVGGILALFERCASFGLEWGADRELHALLGDTSRAFASLQEAAAELAMRGGGVVLQRGGLAVGLVADPLGVAHARFVRQFLRDDAVVFAEYGIQVVPGGDERLLALAVRAADALEETLRPHYGYAAELGWPERRAPHRAAQACALPPADFGYQYLSADYAGRLDLAAVRRAGWAITGKPFGAVALRR